MSRPWKSNTRIKKLRTENVNIFGICIMSMFKKNFLWHTWTKNCYTDLGNIHVLKIKNCGLKGVIFFDVWWVFSVFSVISWWNICAYNANICFYVSLVTLEPIFFLNTPIVPKKLHENRCLLKRNLAFFTLNASFLLIKCVFWNERNFGKLFIVCMQAIHTDFESTFCYI